MGNQLTSNAEALRLFFTEDIYLVDDFSKSVLTEPVTAIATPLPEEAVTIPLAKPNIEVKTITAPLIVEESKPVMAKNFDFKFLGKNENKILILVNDAENETSTLQGRELLRKLVLAIGLTVKDFALVNYAHYIGATFNDLNNVFSPKLLLAFGVSTKQLALEEQALHTLLDFGATKMVFTLNLHDLDGDEASKKLLWTSLKKLKINE